MRHLVSTEMDDCRAEGPRGPWCEIEVFGDDKTLRLGVKKWCFEWPRDAASYSAGVMEVKRMLLEFGL